MTTPNKLTKQQARKVWVSALRSGEYRQGKNRLHDLRNGSEYCCLGVACEMFRRYEGPERLRVSPNIGTLNMEYQDPGDDSLYKHGSFLPRCVRDWLGLSNEHGGFGKPEPDGPCGSLAGLNDAGKTFIEIADIIEECPVGLLKEDNAVQADA